MQAGRALLVATGLLPILAGCGGETAARAAGREGPPPRPVKVVAAVETALPRVVTVTGTLAAEEQVALGMKVAGRLETISVDLGSHAAKGATLARLVPVDFELRVRQSEAIVEQARARLGLAAGATGDDVDPDETPLVRQASAMLAEARARVERARTLSDARLIAPAELDAAEAAYQVAESRRGDALEEVLNRQALLAQRRSELDLARQQMVDSVLRAPFDGAVRERHAAPGQFVAAGEPVVTLVKLHPLRLRLAVRERDAAALRAGQDVRLTIEGDPRTYLGRVARLSPAIDEASRTLAVEAEVPNLDGALRPGSFATASIVTAADDRAILVPRSAIVTFAGIEKVIVVAGGKAVERRVRTGRRDGDRVEILEGIAAGDPVVVDPGNLTGGQPVTVAS